MEQATVLITGHSQGLGAALAEECLRRGAYVVGLARRHNATLAAHYAANLMQVEIDLADADALQCWLAQEADWASWCAGKRNLWLFNNAGTVAPSLLLGKQTAEDIAHAVTLNITAPLILANAVAAQCSASLHCHIVHISSGAAHKTYHGWSVYGACKAALDQHARIASAEQNGIDIVSIAPGVVDTAMQTQLRVSTDFPEYGRFIDLKMHDELQTSEDTAYRIVQYCLGNNFASQPVIDIRDVTL